MVSLSLGSCDGLSLASAVAPDFFATGIVGLVEEEDDPIAVSWVAAEFRRIGDLLSGLDDEAAALFFADGEWVLALIFSTVA